MGGDPRALLMVDDVHLTYRVPMPSSEGGRLRGKRRSLDVEAVRGVSFTVTEGETVALLGRNGSGKSSLLKVVAGLTPATTGRVLADGDPVLLGVGAALVPRISGARNIILGGLAQGLTRDEVMERYDEIVEFAGIGDAIHRPMNTYSSGQGARLRFAIGTALRPRVLLVDEALATGDEEFRLRAEARLRELREHAGCFLLVSHALSTIRETCERAIWLDEGRVVADGPTLEVVDRYRAATAGARSA